MTNHNPKMLTLPKSNIGNCWKCGKEARYIIETKYLIYDAHSLHSPTITMNDAVLEVLCDACTPINIKPSKID